MKSMKDKTVILENPETTQEYVQYTWDGLRMLVNGGLVLVWRGVKAGVSAIRSALNKEEKEGKGDGNGDGDGKGNVGTEDESKAE